MVTVILLALSTSVGSVISVIAISDVTFAACPTITNDATFIGAILAGATTCCRKGESDGAGEEGEGRGQERKGGAGWGWGLSEGWGQESKGEGRSRVGTGPKCS